MATIQQQLSESIAAIEKARKEISQQTVPVSKGTVKNILKLQKMAVELRDTTIRLLREQEWTLTEIGAAFELSGSRVSQISRKKKLSRSRRIQASKKPKAK